MYMRYLVCILAITLASVARADSVTIGSTRYDDVYIIESDAVLYVSRPDTGSTISIQKDDPTLGAVEISDDEELRASLYARYKAARDRDKSPDQSTAASPPHRTNVIESLVIQSDFDPASISDRIQARTTPVFVLRGESRPPSPPAMPARQAGAGRSTGRSFTPGGGGASANRFGEMGGGSGDQRRAGGDSRGGAGGQRSGAGFTNISELFTTVDDASVGESPNPITGR